MVLYPPLALIAPFQDPVRYCPEGPWIVILTLRNRGHRRRLAAAGIAAVTLFGAGLVAVTKFLPRLRERAAEIERLKAQNEERRRQVEGREPLSPLSGPSEEQLRERLKIIKPAESAFVIQMRDARVQQAPRFSADHRWRPSEKVFGPRTPEPTR